MELKDCILGRRSIRRYTGEKIPRETLEKIVSLAAYAPSWKNAQPSRYVIVTDKAVIERIAGEAVLGFAHNASILRNCAALAVQTILSNRSGYERDGTPSTAKGSHWESFDAGVAAQTFCLAAHEQGVGTCILGIFDDAKVAEIIDLPSAQSVACLIPMGYPAERPNAPMRRAAAELVKYIE